MIKAFSSKEIIAFEEAGYKSVTTDVETRYERTRFIKQSTAIIRHRKTYFVFDDDRYISLKENKDINYNNYYSLCDEKLTERLLQRITSEDVSKIEECLLFMNLLQNTFQIKLNNYSDVFRTELPKNKHYFISKRYGHCESGEYRVSFLLEKKKKKEYETVLRLSLENLDEAKTIVLQTR